MADARSLPRLLTGVPGHPASLVEHRARYGAASPGPGLLDQLEAAGLTGRGGAAFPTARKAAVVRAQRGHTKVLVVNAMEGEPAAHKDRTLLATNPHLVLDGATALARAIGATRVAVAVARDEQATVRTVRHALSERDREDRGLALELHTPPWRYVAGEESALVHWLNDHQALPQYRPSRPSILRVAGAPALVDNAETCAHVALIARHGAAWFRALGTEASPGTTLVSVTGAVARPTVVELALGTPLRAALRAAGADLAPQAVLLGGYGGTWLAASHLDAPLANEALHPLGASVGAGVIVVLPADACGLRETLRITRWMAHESARQCGPCAFGLPALALDLQAIVAAGPDAPAAVTRLAQRADVIAGRGACRHPDGVVRLVRSALDVFAAHLDAHRRGRPCAAGARRPVVAVPELEPEEDLVWQ